MMDATLQQSDRVLLEAPDLFSRRVVFDRDVLQTDYDVSRTAPIRRCPVVRDDFRFDKQAHQLSWKKTTSRIRVSAERRRWRRPRSLAPPSSRRSMVREKPPSGGTSD